VLVAAACTGGGGASTARDSAAPSLEAAAIPGRPAAATCAALRPPRWHSPNGTTDARGDLRVIGIQAEQRLQNVTSYATFRTAMRCLMEDFVVPYEVPGRPTLVVFNEDIGLMTLAIGPRGAAARRTTSALGALDALARAYAPQIAAYRTRFGPIDARKAVFLAATDTFVRAFDETFADIARDYRVYVVAGNSQAAYRPSNDAQDVATFRDPAITTGPAYVATSSRVTNDAIVWGPDGNVVLRNEKIPLTNLESTVYHLDEGPRSGPAAVANVAGFRLAGHRIGIATSLPAFRYGMDFGQPPPQHPCADLRVSYMTCMDAQGVDVVVQDEANPGQWAVPADSGTWQPLEWMQSTWRAVADPSVHFRYNVTPMLTGNLLDLPFDGQSAITMRGARRPAVGYVGTADGPAPYGGPKPEFLALATWVVPDGPRATLTATSKELLSTNDYVETAVFADLTPAR
jgi:predicted amidohydrolase